MGKYRIYIGFVLCKNICLYESWGKRAYKYNKLDIEVDRCAGVLVYDNVNGLGLCGLKKLCMFV